MMISRAAVWAALLAAACGVAPPALPAAQCLPMCGNLQLPSRECLRCLEQDGFLIQLPYTYAQDMLQIPQTGSYVVSWCGKRSDHPEEGVDTDVHPTGWEHQGNGTYTGCERSTDYPGVGTVSIQEHSKVKEGLARLPRRQEAGEVWRGNELGFIILSPVFYGNVKPNAIFLGSTVQQHKVVRPILERVWGGCDAECFAEMQRSAQKFVNGKQELAEQDWGGWAVEQIFQSIFPGEAQPFTTEDFLALQQGFLQGNIQAHFMPRFLARLAQLQTLQQLSSVRDGVRQLTEKYFGAEVEGKDCGENSCVDQLAGAFTDALLLAGGLSVPATLRTALFVMFANTSDYGETFPQRGEDELYTPENGERFVLETMRFFPPVVGVPFWTTFPAAAEDPENGNQYVPGAREVLNIALAQRDPNAWGDDASKFRVRSAAEYRKKFVGFADFAQDDGVEGMDRTCPAKWFSVRMAQAFLDAVHAVQDDWQVAPGQDVTYQGATPFVSGLVLHRRRRLDTLPGLLCRDAENRRAEGRLVFEKSGRALHNMLVRVMDASVGDGLGAVLGENTTDMQGRFRVEFSVAKGRAVDLKVVPFLPETRYDEEGNDASIVLPVRNYRPRVLHNNVDAVVQFGRVAVALYEYAPRGETATPRLLVDATHRVEQDRHEGLEEQWSRNGLVAVGMNATGVFPPTRYSLQEAVAPGSGYSDENIVDLLLNGHNPTLFRREGYEFAVDYTWDGVEQDGIHWAPDTIAYFRLNTGKQTYTLHRIELRLRQGDLSSSSSAYHQQTYTAASTAGTPGLWERVKRAFLTNYFVFGEVVTHLTGTHYNMEQYNMAVVRNVRANPVLALLSPHWHGLTEVNHQAQGLTASVIPDASAATEQGIQRAAGAGLGSFNWHDFRPRAPQAAGDTFARAGNVFWEVVQEYVDGYFDEHEEKILANWEEVKLMSDDLVEHAVAYTAPDPRVMDRNELNKESSPRVEVPGVGKVAVSPVTQRATGVKAGDEDWKNLKQMCAYVIYQCTFMHSWVNDRQWVLGGAPSFLSLGLTYDIVANVTRPIADALPVPETRRVQIVLWVLEMTQYGYILRDESSDMNPRLKHLLRQREEEMAALNIDVANIRSTLAV